MHGAPLQPTCSPPVPVLPAERWQRVVAGVTEEAKGSVGTAPAASESNLPHLILPSAPAEAISDSGSNTAREASSLRRVSSHASMGRLPGWFLQTERHLKATEQKACTRLGNSALQLRVETRIQARRNQGSFGRAERGKEGRQQRAGLTSPTRGAELWKLKPRT